MNPIWLMTKDACRNLDPQSIDRVRAQKILAVTTIALAVLCGTALMELPLLMNLHPATYSLAIMEIGTLSLGLTLVASLAVTSFDQWKKIAQLEKHFVRDLSQQKNASLAQNPKLAKLCLKYPRLAGPQLIKQALSSLGDEEKRLKKRPEIAEYLLDHLIEAGPELSMKALRAIGDEEKRLRERPEIADYLLDHLIEVGPELSMKALRALDQQARQAFYLKFKNQLASLSSESNETDREKYLRVYGKAGQDYTDQEMLNLEDTLAQITMAFSQDILSRMEKNRRGRAAAESTYDDHEL